MGQEDETCRICACFLREDGECSNPHCSTHRQTVRAPKGTSAGGGFSSKPSRRISYKELLRRKPKSLAGAYDLLASGLKTPPLPNLPVTESSNCPPPSFAEDDGDRPTPVEVPTAQDGERHILPDEGHRTKSGTRRRTSTEEIPDELDKEKAGNG